MTEQFNTVQYCIDNTIPCFSFAMDATKKNNITWQKITAETQPKYIHSHHNGFAIITGHTHIMLDVDLKHNVPKHITTSLKTYCAAYERTPGGYHFYFLTEDRTRTMKTNSAIRWHGEVILGLDIRAQGGISYADPSNYIGDDGTEKRYHWIHGNLSTAESMPDVLFDAIYHEDLLHDKVEPYAHMEQPVMTDERWSTVHKLVGMLSVSRATEYTAWRNVVFCLKNMEDSERSLELAHEFSKKSTAYDVRGVNTLYRRSRPKDCKLLMGSLYYWAKQDSPQEYVKMKSFEKSIEINLTAGTNASIAEVFYELNPDRYRYSAVEGWYILQRNNIWLSTGSKDTRSIPALLNAISEDCGKLILNMVERLNLTTDSTSYKLLVDTMKRLNGASFVKGVAEFLQGKYYCKDIENMFNQNRDLLAFTNGVFDTKRLYFRAIEPDDYITITTGYEFRHAIPAEKEKVRAFLQKIFPSVPVYDYMLQALSICLTGHNLSESFHILTGTGANGKSILMDLCRKLLGEYYKTISVCYLTKENDGKDKALPELVGARYARMLVASEPEERDRFQTSFMKLITGNDPISCRGMYKSSVEFIAQFKLWVLTNELPKMSKYDRGMERRTRCVHFPTRFVYRPIHDHETLIDETLKSKIQEDPSWVYGLLGLLLDALEDHHGQSFIMPKEVEEFTEKYLLENNPVGAWIKKYYDRTNNREDIIQRTELYQAFLQDTGIHKSQKIFSEDMVKCNINTKALDGKYYYYGLLKKDIIVEE